MKETFIRIVTYFVCGAAPSKVTAAAAIQKPKKLKPLVPNPTVSSDAFAVTAQDIRSGFLVTGATSMSALALLLFCLVINAPSFAEQGPTNSDSADKWKVLFTQAHLLEGSTALLPSLLPFVLKNADALQLTDDQMRSFRRWRKDNYSDMVDLMNEVIALKVQFRSESMVPRVSSDYLLDIQNRIHALQRELLELRLSCRQLLMTTFSEEQWNNFAFIASDHPRYSNLLIQHNAIYPYMSFEEWVSLKMSEIAPASGATREKRDE